MSIVNVHHYKYYVSLTNTTHKSIEDLKRSVSLLNNELKYIQYSFNPNLNISLELIVSSPEDNGLYNELSNESKIIPDANESIWVGALLERAIKNINVQLQRIF